jgi:hypothetical protein
MQYFCLQHCCLWKATTNQLALPKRQGARFIKIDKKCKIPYILK